MADAFTFAPWSGVSKHEAVPVDAETKLNETPATPIQTQPACFRVCTPFPLASSAGGVKVAGKNATEMGFSFPPLGDAQLTSFREINVPQTETRNWNRLQAEMKNTTEQNAAPSFLAPTRLNAVGRLNQSLPPVTSTMELPFRRQSSENDSRDSAIGDNIPCRESLSRLSISDRGFSTSPFADESNQKENEALLSMDRIPEHDSGEMARLEEMIEQKNHELAQAHSEIERLVDCIKTLEFKRDEYRADDGALGMAEYLRTLQKELRLEEGWQKELVEEQRKRAAYQNRYYEMVSKNADLEERVEKLLQERQPPIQPPQGAEAQLVMPAPGMRPKRRIAVRTGGSKKMRGTAKRR